MLDGKKTYLVAALMAVVAFLKQLGLEIPQNVIDTILWLLGAAGLASLRHAVGKAETQLLPEQDGRGRLDQ